MKRSFKNIDKAQMAHINRKNVFHCIEEYGPINRAAIAEKCHLSIPAVLTITDTLIEAKMIEVSGIREGNCGKRPELLDVIPDARFIAGVDIGRSTLRFIIRDLKRNVIHSSKRETGEVIPTDAFIMDLCDWINLEIDNSGIDVSRLAGVGIAMPGLIEKDDGCVLFSPDFGWRNVPLLERLKEIIAYPVVVENANRMIALAESQESDNGKNNVFVCLNIGHGIGAGILINGELYRGAEGTCGEIGHITVRRDGAMCSCGNTGCLEAEASGNAIAGQAAAAVKAGAAMGLIEKFGSDPDRISAKDVFELANEGDHFCQTLIDRAAENIGIGIAGIINILNPAEIVLCGGLMRNGTAFFDQIEEATKKHLMYHVNEKTVLSPGKQGEYGTAMGAAAYMCREVDAEL